MVKKDVESSASPVYRQIGVTLPTEPGESRYELVYSDQFGSWDFDKLCLDGELQGQIAPVDMTFRDVEFFYRSQSPNKEDKLQAQALERAKQLLCEFHERSKNLRLLYAGEGIREIQGARVENPGAMNTRRLQAINAIIYQQNVLDEFGISQAS